VSTLSDLDRCSHRSSGEGTARYCVRECRGGEVAAIGKITEEHYHSIFDINVKGLLFTVQKALPLLRDGASIILNASIVASKGSPEWSVYSATRPPCAPSREWTTDLKDRRIRVNASEAQDSRTRLRGMSPSGEQRLEDCVQPAFHSGDPDARGNRQGRRISSIRRQQLHHGNGIVRDGGFAQV